MRTRNFLLFFIFAFCMTPLLGHANITNPPMIKNRPEIPSIPHITEKKKDVKVNINTADVKTLMSLKKIGKKKAEAIIAYREKNGKFIREGELLKIKGISAKIITLNHERLSF